MSVNLRDSLLAALARLPGTREFHLHVLISSPRKHASLFPFASPRPRAYLQDILILLSEQATPDSPRVFVSAVEACVYNMASTSCAILYISKVDSTGQATLSSPTTTLVRSLLTFYADPTTRPIAAAHLWIHLFARAQAQYLFPNSANFPGKKPLSDIRLCGWWKRLLSEVVAEVEKRIQSRSKIKLYYLLPGYGELDAVHALKSVLPITTAPSPWIYGHPYSQTEIPLPCPPDSSEGMKNLGHFIPSFDDDPKSRFMDEIAYTTDGDIKSPVRKRMRTSSHGDSSHPKENEHTDDRALGELRKVSPDDFWERMSFRQECVAGAITGFFAIGVSSSVDGNDVGRSAISPLAPEPGQVSSQMNKRVLTLLISGVDFSTVERSIRATEIVEGAIKRLCEGISPIPTSFSHAPRPSAKPEKIERRTPEREITPKPSLLAPPTTPPPRITRGSQVVPDISPNPFPEPVTSLDTYNSHIYGSCRVSNPLPKLKATKSVVVEKDGGGAGAHVTVLTVRKKKKRVE